MRTDFPRPLTHFVCAALLLVSALVAGSTAAWAQPTTTTPRAGWRVGGTTNAMARLGNVLYIGGQFRGVAPEANASGSTLVVDAVSGLPIPGFPGFGGLTGAIEPDGAGGWIWAATSLTPSMAPCRHASGWLTCWPTATSIRPGRRRPRAAWFVR